MRLPSPPSVLDQAKGGRGRTAAAAAPLPPSLPDPVEGRGGGRWRRRRWLPFLLPDSARGRGRAATAAAPLPPRSIWRGRGEGDSSTPAAGTGLPSPPLPLPLPPKTVTLDLAGGGRAEVAARPEVGRAGAAVRVGWWLFFLFAQNIFASGVAIPPVKIIYFHKPLHTGGPSPTWENNFWLHGKTIFVVVLYFRRLKCVSKYFFF